MSNEIVYALYVYCSEDREEFYGSFDTYDEASQRGREVVEGSIWKYEIVKSQLVPFTGECIPTTLAFGVGAL